LFDVCDYTASFDLGQSPVSFDEPGDQAPPLAICHIGPSCSGSGFQGQEKSTVFEKRSVSFYSGVLERDTGQKKKKQPLSFHSSCLAEMLHECGSPPWQCLFLEFLVFYLGWWRGLAENSPVINEKGESVHIDQSILSGTAGTRGRVLGLSRRSRLRLQVRINRCVFKAGHVWFLTLTYPREFPAHCVAKDDLRAFLKRVSRKWGKRGAIWRIENQKRGAPHFHIVLFLAAAVPESQFVEWVSRSWHAVVGSGDDNHLFYGAKAELFRSARGVASYCSKYVSKPEEGERIRLIEGRQWGREGDFPEERVDFSFSEKDFFRFWRILRRSKGLVGHVGPGGGHPWKNIFSLGLHDDWIRLASKFGTTTGEIVRVDFYE